jgi:Zn-dependent peptidase ImmA (M78 family)
LCSFFALYHLLPTSIPPLKIPAGLPERIESLEAIEVLANMVRKAWKLGENPIPDLMDTLEAHGILVLLTSTHKGEKFDGLSAWANNVPVIVVGADWPGDRQRFTLAHELGHLLLKDRLVVELDEEKAADHFAGAFLVPASAALQALGKHRTWLEPRELMLLKQEYGLSMGGWLFRAYQLGILNLKRFQIMQGFFRKRGWHRQEPGKPYPREQIRRFSRSVYHALAEDLINESKAAELLGTSLMELHAECCVDVADAAAH